MQKQQQSSLNTFSTLAYVPRVNFTSSVKHKLIHRRGVSKHLSFKKQDRRKFLYVYLNAWLIRHTHTLKLIFTGRSKQTKHKNERNMSKASSEFNSNFCPCSKKVDCRGDFFMGKMR